MPPARFDFALKVASPPELAPRAGAARLGAGPTAPAVTATTDPEAAAAGADCVVTDTWVSMGDEEARAPPQSSAALSGQRPADGEGARRMRSSCIACPPIAARRSPTRSSTGPQSVVFDEAENRLHAQKGILAWCLGWNDGMTVTDREDRRASRPGRATMPCCPFEVAALDVRGRVIQMGPAHRRHPRPPRLSDAGVAAARRGDGARRPARLLAEVRRQVHPADRDRRAGRHAGRRLPHRRRRPRLCPLRCRAAWLRRKPPARPSPAPCSATARSP